VPWSYFFERSLIFSLSQRRAATTLRIAGDEKLR
jgi:hypothetical protein